MMKRNILAVVIPALLVAGAANAAEIGNAVNLLMTILICSHSILVTSG
ncbi:TPA: hypothetical protein ACPXRG_003678 [Klebsiella pneumoniae]